jgi:thiol-disulfide isomerase/thioredoxin
VLTRLSGGENRYGLKFSSEVQGGAGLSRSFTAPRALSSFLSGARLGLRVHGVKSGHDYDQGKMVSNTGGQWLYLLPALNLETKNGVAYFFQFQLPVYQNVNGGQLVAPYGFTTGVSFTPFRKRERAELAQPPGPSSAEPELISKGERVSLEQHLVAGRVTVFEFYADWCNVCKKIEAPLKRMLLGRQDVTLKRINLGDGETAVTKQYAITTTPTFYVYSPTGKLVKTFATDELSKLEAAIQAAKAADYPYQTPQSNN